MTPDLHEETCVEEDLSCVDRYEITLEVNEMDKVSALVRELSA